MQVSAATKRLLLIRDEEWTLVSRMFAFEFFQGASIALFFTSAFSLFLDYLQRVNLPISEMSKVFILASFLLWFFGWLFSKLEHMLSVKVLTIGVLLFNALSIVTFRLYVYQDQAGWFYYLMLAWFNVIYLLNNLEFWGLASRLFDVRQSRRLFAIISAGDIPAKFIGFIAAIVFVPIIGSHELLWVAAGSSLLSLLFFHRVISLDAFQAELQQARHSHHNHTDHRDAKPLSVYNLIAGDKLTRQVAFISFFTLCCYIIANYVFYGYVKQEFHSDRSLAVFIAWFLALSRAITLIIKLLFTNRIADRFGIIRSLLITPAALAILCVCSFFAYGDSTYYFFGMMAIVTDVLRSAIQSPVLLSTLQPLSLQRRLQGHNIMKGVMDPFAYFVVGVLLYGLYHFSSNLNLHVLGGLILIMIIFWIIWIFSADKNYIQTLTSAIRNRSINEREIELGNAESFEVLHRKISGPDEGDAIFALQLIKSQQLKNKSMLVEIGLRHSGAAVRHYAISMVSEFPDDEASALLNHIINNDKDHQLRATAIMSLSNVDKVKDYSPFLLEEESIVSCAAIAAIIKIGMPLQRNIAEKKLQELCISHRKNDRKCAAEILGEIHDDSLHPLLETLLNDEDADVVRAAMSSVRILKSPELASVVLKSYNRTNKTLIFQILQSLGPAAVPVIRDYIHQYPHSELLPRLMLILGSGGGHEGQQSLNQLLDELPQCPDAVLHALHLSKFHVERNEVTKYLNLTRTHMNAAVQILYRIFFLSKNHDELLSDALQSEFHDLRDRLLAIFTLLYDGEKIQRAKTGLKINTRESIANSLELIDQLVAKEFSHPFICLYEPGDLGRKCIELRKSFAEPHLSLPIIRNHILRDKGHDYSAWTKACVIYVMAIKKEKIDSQLIEPLKFSSNKLLSETANFALTAQSSVSKS